MPRFRPGRGHGRAEVAASPSKSRGAHVPAVLLTLLIHHADRAYRHHRRVLLGVAIAVLLVHGTLAVQKMGEFKIQYDAAVRTLAGEVPYQSTDRYYFTYSPAVLFLYAPFTLVSLPVAKAAWYVGAVGLLALNLIVAGRLTRLRPSPAVYLLTAACTIRHLANNLMRGQITPLIFAAILVSWLLDERRQFKQAGLAMAIAIHTKLYPGLAGLLFVLQQRWKTLGATIVAALGLLILPVVFFPLGQYPQVLMSWLGLTWAQSSHGCFQEPINQSIAAFFYRFLSDDPNHVAIVHLPLWVPLGLTIITHALALSTIVVIVRRAQAVSNTEARAVARSAGAALLLIYLAVAVPCSHKYNLLGEVLGYTTLLCVFCRRPSNGVAAAILGSTLVSYVAAIRPLEMLCANLWSAAILFVGCAVVAHRACGSGWSDAESGVAVGSYPTS